MRPTASILAACALASSALSVIHCATHPGSSADTCQPEEPDGLLGGSATLYVSVSDTAFTPAILKAENLATVTLTLANGGSRPHGFAVQCMPTPNAQGCPSRSCFPDASTIAPIQPDASATVTFTAPNPEGIYVFRSSAPTDTMTGQLVVQ